MPNSPLNLKARAHQAMVEAGFHPDFPREVLQEAESLQQAAAASAPSGRDLRELLWSSVDNDTSRDLDQVEYVEALPDGAVRLLIGIADVEWAAAQGSLLDRRAAAEATSVYTGVAIFPMLPAELSTGLTSLLDAQDRSSMIIELRVQDSGEVIAQDVYPGLVRNRAKLAYSSTGAWLEGRGPLPPAAAAVPGMEAQLRLQKATSEKLRALRKQHGALTFGSIEATPVLAGDEVKGLEVRRHNAAEDIIESFMVAANVGMARYLREKGCLSLRRVVKTPRRWDRIQAIAAQFGSNLPATPDPRALCQFLEQRQAADPEHFPDLSISIVKLLGPGEYIVETPGAEHEGHFGLAVNDYTHSTAPNRRYADLVTQRLLKASAGGRPGPYSESELSGIAVHCTEREDAARKVERLMHKVVAASLLSGRIGEVFDGIITGASPKGTYVRLLTFPAEGRVVQGAQGLDVGDKVRVRLSGVNVAHGFIDLARS
ncbi:MAG TPA: RNB domain-containing ribonuclease [Candidatus Limnocylindrales bacterium]|nr:RNB domain-containing ribonuclease [Candidatus Limnocylindrales bacterium]